MKDWNWKVDEDLIEYAGSDGKAFSIAAIVMVCLYAVVGSLLLLLR